MMPTIEAEISVLGSMLLAEDAVDIAVETLTVEDFADHRNQIVWKHMLGLHHAGKPCTNARLLTSSLDNAKAGDRTDLEEIGGLAYLAQVAEAVVSHAHAPYFIEQVRRDSTARKLQRVGREIAALAAHHGANEDTDELIGRCEQLVLDVRGQRQQADHRSLQQLVFDALERIDRRCSGESTGGIPTGIVALDNMLGGLRAGELIVIGARPGCGKSALAINIAQHMAMRDARKVLLTSLEMSSAEVVERILGNAAKVSTHRMRNGTCSSQERHRICEASGSMASAQLFVDDRPSCTCAQIASQARSINRRHGLDAVIVDYLQLISPDNPKEIRQEQVAKISRRLKTLARELQVPIICLAQLNRQAADDTRAPKLAHLRESGAIEQDADVVLLIHRPQAHLPDNQVSHFEPVELHVAKHRNGPTGIVNLRWFRSYCAFDAGDDGWEERKDSSFDDWNGSP